MTDRQLTRLADIQFLTNTTVAYVTTGVDERLGVRKIRVHNTDSSTRTVNIYRVPDNGSGSPLAVTGGHSIEEVDLPAGTDWTFEYLHLTMENQGEAIFAVASVTGVVNIEIDGVSSDDPDDDLRQFKRMLASTFISNTTATIITNGANERNTIREFIAHNITSSPVELKIYRIPDVAAAVGTAAPVNRFTTELIAAKGTRKIRAEITQEDTNDTIAARAATASAIVMSADGVFEDRS